MRYVEILSWHTSGINEELQNISHMEPQNPDSNQGPLQNKEKTITFRHTIN